MYAVMVIVDAFRLSKAHPVTKLGQFSLPRGRVVNHKHSNRDDQTSM